MSHLVVFGNAAKFRLVWPTIAIVKRMRNAVHDFILLIQVVLDLLFSTLCCLVDIKLEPDNWW